MKKILLIASLITVGLFAETNNSTANEVKAINKEGQKTFNNCVSCHGVNGAKRALGKSGLLAGQDEATIFDKLIKYKKGELNTVGLGGLMKAQVAQYNEKQLKDLAEYIASIEK